MEGKTATRVEQGTPTKVVERKPRRIPMSASSEHDAAYLGLLVTTISTALLIWSMFVIILVVFTWSLHQGRTTSKDLSVFVLLIPAFGFASVVEALAVYDVLNKLLNANPDEYP